MKLLLNHHLLEASFHHQVLLAKLDPLWAPLESLNIANKKSNVFSNLRIDTV